MGTMAFPAEVFSRLQALGAMAQSLETAGHAVDAYRDAPAPECASILPT